jgi:hypothetical protein
MGDVNEIIEHRLRTQESPIAHKAPVDTRGSDSNAFLQPYATGMCGANPSAIDDCRLETISPNRGVCFDEHTGPDVRIPFQYDSCANHRPTFDYDIGTDDAVRGNLRVAGDPAFEALITVI